MPEITPYHLTFPHGLHVGRGVENLAESRVDVPSDTLYAALLETWRLMGREVKDLLADGKAEPQFRLTSAFPFAGDIRFYPMPIDLRAVFGEAILRSLDKGKTAKKFRYFSHSLMELARAGQKLDQWFPDDKQTQALTLQNGALWLTADEINLLSPAVRNRRDKNGKLTDQPLPFDALPRQMVWQNHTVPRVTVDRINSSPNLFQSERVRFSEGCGLWFGMSGEFAQLKEMLGVLGENGLGGERTAGYGKFTYKDMQSANFPDPSDNLDAYLLSRYHPREGETTLLKHDRSSYRLEAVDGYLRTFDGAAQRRKRVWLVCEGSIIKGNPRGDAPDVRPTYQNPEGDVVHPVYRPGFALAVGWKS